MVYLDETTMVARIAMAGALGMIIGLERERHSKAAGLRSCILVCMAGALLMSLSLYLTQLFASNANDSMIRMDPGRLPSYAIAGMGFLGAGAIIQGRRSAWGVTTGAAMWVLTGVGLSVGAGLYLPAFVVVALTFVALAFFPTLARLLPKEQLVVLSLEADSRKAVDGVRDLLKHYGAHLIFLGKNRCLESDTVSATFRLRIISGAKWATMLDELEQVPDVTCYSWHEADVP
ncbi:MgtC/SapB transporter [Desulfarculus baarsii DSM 2075]|uniref:MgtC/SapB transporter n=1 Tax=Desulfarculus baarsii (strain ATCC 33931 / DSM 2075 / LMG 7858 / VKM B-1802 / 2st14) TaxID=644282 RepID=E1QDL9_DESB2|nr:MgtC/SapB family protein [Desulfarculus baarsii]ADK83538.1 MgtC/SapB transporter [Desulfarculus baarsii DSM 2075]